MKSPRLFKREIKLTYTDEMKEQDRLWEHEQEDSKVMQRLQLAIVEQAHEKGFKGVASTYTLGGETVTEVYKTVEEFKKHQQTGNNYTDEIHGTCKGLILLFERLINK